MTGIALPSAAGVHPEQQQAANTSSSAPTPIPGELTKPATFHLPIGQLQRLRATCRLKNTTMVDFVRKAIDEALEKQRPTEEEIRKLLGA